MGEFFRGWRRKVGYVTLVMACLFTSGWVRSKYVNDLVDAGPIGVASLDNSLALVAWGRNGAKLSWHFPKWETSEPTTLTSELSVPIEWRWYFLGYAYSGPPLYDKIWIAAYGPIVMPLILLSAYLILWKPRKRKAESDA